MLLVCLLTAFSVTNIRAAIAAFDRPSAISPSTSRSRGVSVLERVVGGRAPGQQLRDHLGIHRRAAAGHLAHRVDERARR